MIKDKLDNLYGTEMSRYDFLKYVGVILLSILGVTRLLSTLSQVPGTNLHTAIRHGYGASPYGGSGTTFND